MKISRLANFLGKKYKNSKIGAKCQDNLDFLYVKDKGIYIRGEDDTNPHLTVFKVITTLKREIRFTLNIQRGQARIQDFSTGGGQQISVC